MVLDTAGKELGNLLESGQAALILIGESRVEEQLEKALIRAEKSLAKEIDADSKELKRKLKKQKWRRPRVSRLAVRRHASSQKKSHAYGGRHGRRKVVRLAAAPTANHQLAPAVPFTP